MSACLWIKGYKGNVVLIVQEVHDSDWTVANPGAEQHEETDLRLHPTALYTEKKHNYTVLITHSYSHTQLY